MDPWVSFKPESRMNMIDKKNMIFMAQMGHWFDAMGFEVFSVFPYYLKIIVKQV